VHISLKFQTARESQALHSDKNTSCETNVYNDSLLGFSTICITKRIIRRKLQQAHVTYNYIHTHTLYKLRRCMSKWRHIPYLRVGTWQFLFPLVMFPWRRLVMRARSRSMTVTMLWRSGPMPMSLWWRRPWRRFLRWHRLFSGDDINGRNGWGHKWRCWCDWSRSRSNGDDG